MHNHRRLHVWRRANDVAIEIHRHFAAQRRRRELALAEQMKRSVASIAANIAEGAGQGTDAQFARYLGIAGGSCREAENHLELAVAIGIVSEAQYRRWAGELGQLARMLTALQRRVRSTQGRAAGPRP